MGYPPRIIKHFEKAGIAVGDTIQLISRGRTYEGILMPHHEFSSKDIVTIKLDSGYNIGIELDTGCDLKLLRKGLKTEKPVHGSGYDSTKPTVAVLGTGGTIASYVDYRTGAVHPALSAEDLAYSVPELADIANIHAKILYSIFSEDMTAGHWQSLAREAALELNSGAMGVVIPHGTDTMGYTAAALSFMLRNLSGPVILVGAQRSSDRPSSDSGINLLSAVDVALNSDLGEVVVMMHGETSDSSVTIHSGTNVRKMHTSARHAFSSINQEPLGFVRGGSITLSEPCKKKGKGPVEVLDKMEENVALLYSYPGITADQFNNLAETNKGIVIAGTGLGHVPQGLVEGIEEVISRGVFVVMTSQCLYGRVNMNVYSRGRDLLAAGVISGEDMPPETAFVKLMWVLGQTGDAAEVRNLMESDIAGEISNRRDIFSKKTIPGN